jgi:hypothetical protein
MGTDAKIPHVSCPPPGGSTLPGPSGRKRHQVWLVENRRSGCDHCFSSSKSSSSKPNHSSQLSVNCGLTPSESNVQVHSTDLKPAETFQSHFAKCRPDAISRRSRNDCGMIVESELISGVASLAAISPPLAMKNLPHGALALHFSQGADDKQVKSSAAAFRL